jgi:HK97 family phage portal protein
MGLFSRIFGGESASIPRIEPNFQASSPENPSTNLANPADWLIDWSTGGMAPKWGPLVTEQTSMAISAVYRCVSIISGIGCDLPIKFYKQTPDGKVEIPNHPLSDFFSVAPMPGAPMSSFLWRELWFMNLLLWGNHYSIIRRNGAGEPIGFELVLPWNCTVLRKGRKNVYRCILWGNMTGFVETSTQETVEYVNQEDMIHIPGPGFNGITGMSRIRSFARSASSLAVLLEDQTGYVHENAAKPSAFVTPGKKLDQNAFKRFKAQFDMRNTGRPNAGRVIYGDDGATYTAMQMTPEDLNTIEARRYQVADISRFFGVPLHLLNEVEKSTAWGSGLSEQNLAFGIYTVNPDLARVMAELNMKLLAGTGTFMDFDRHEMLAMDPIKATDVAQKEIASGTLTINERRKKLNRPPVPDGDKPLINSTNISLEALFRPGAQPRQDPIQADPVPAKEDVGTTPNGPTDPNAVV